MEIKVVRDIMSANDKIAARNREYLDSNAVLALNLMSSPGAGKTSLVLRTVEGLRGKMRVGVIEGDIASRVDADRIAKEGVPVVQINTGGACHLDANMLNTTLADFPLMDVELLIIENVGNLVCPAEFALGEHKKAMILSLPEGDDKPLKYPLMFATTDVVVVNKMDLAPLLDFSIDSFVKRVRGLNPNVIIFKISCKTGEGLDEWISWMLKVRRV
ncbi:MAG: hydrogenase nickel incorporation protein HypB [Chloroflexota bacterium]|nr:hydrogenase nickel incorporation protein HypB [Chloroflexota bacterium]